MENEEIARYEAIDRKQVVLEKLDIEELIPADHAARNIWEVLGRVDLSRFEADVKAVEGHAGRSRWEPRLLIAIWVYAYTRGISSAREIERQCGHEPALRWLTGLKIVNHHTLSDFRVKQGEALQNLFVQVLGILTMEKLVTLDRVTVDGTKVRAHVNKKTFSRAEKIREHLKLARRHVEQLQNEEAEQEKRGRQAQANRRAARERVERLEDALAEVTRLQAEKKNERTKEAQASVTDPDAQFMRTSDHGLAPSYNVQLVTDARHKLIVDVEVSKQPSDAYHLLPALERVKMRAGIYPGQVVADGDYTNREAVMGAAAREVDFYGSWRSDVEERLPYGIDEAYHPAAFRYDERHDRLICPEGKYLEHRATRERAGARMHVYTALRQDCQACPKKTLCTPENKMTKHGRAVTICVDADALTQYRSKMKTKAGKDIYRQRAAVAEFPNAWLKDKLRWTRLRCRGIVKARAEALWTCLTYNLHRYFRLRTLQSA